MIIILQIFIKFILRKLNVVNFEYIQSNTKTCENLSSDYVDI